MSENPSKGTPKRLKIAVVGAGVAGLTASYLLSRKHDVILFEKNDYLGGHTNTIIISDGPDAGTPVDTGFIVCNNRNYPQLLKLFSELGVTLRDSDMTFGYFDESTGFQYSSVVPAGLFAQRRNAMNPLFLRMLWDILRFNRKAKRDLDSGHLAGKTLGDYIGAQRLSRAFRYHYLLPMGAAVWSTPLHQMLDFPAEAFIRFLDNHGLLSINNMPQWKTVVGGSHMYVQKIRSKISGGAKTSAAVTKIARTDNGILLTLGRGDQTSFDAVIIGTHADEALELLADPSSHERRLLGAWTYSRNETLLHTDVSAMPTRRRAWASWNYVKEKGGTDLQPVSVTYYMNRLQGLATQHQYFVTLNTSRLIPPKKIIRQITYTHPNYTFASMASQKELPKLQGVRHTYYCGSYFGYGFHEDAVQSALTVTRHFGLDL